MSKIQWNATSGKNFRDTLGKYHNAQHQLADTLLKLQADKKSNVESIANMESTLESDNATIDKMVFKQADQAEVNPDYPIDAVFGKKVKRPDDYNDVRPQVVEDLQDYLEQEWVADLRRRYQVEVNKEVLKTVNKHL